MNHMIEIRDEIALHTGDILLFRGNTLFSCFKAPYEHVAIVLKNPSFLEEGLYVLECTETIHIYPFEERLQRCRKGSVDVRQIHCIRNQVFHQKIKDIYYELHENPNMIPLIDSFVAYFFSELGLITPVYGAIPVSEWSSNGSISFLCRVNEEKNIY